eukprot:TRINITY_DN12364_c0_g1_i1.p1 TRINITY_DN12364_c0_g1~~TRINITY_DN12364_c0_g1_i1.p1  ORF type:complete len:609 (+),score=138.12 TRINITY_DN12364_c0_g1_i1:48-1874(+)
MSRSAVLARLEEATGQKKNEEDESSGDEDEESEEEDEAQEEHADQEQMKEKLKKEAEAPGPEPDLMMDDLNFTVAVSVVCVANMFVLGSRADYKCATNHCTDDTTNLLWALSDQLFTALFVIEILVRFVEAKPRRFFCGERTKVTHKLHMVNCIDVVIVFLRVLDCWILTPAGVDQNLKNISTFRIMRLMQLAGHLRRFKAFTEFYLVLSSVGETLRTLLWNAVLILLSTWVLAILMRMAVMGLDDSGAFNMRRAGWTFTDYWGSVGSCFLSLVQLLFRDRWGDALLWPLIEKSPSLLFVFIPFYCLGSLALMNSVTGVVVECTLSSSKANEELEAKERSKVDELVMQSLRQIFMEADTDGSGELDREELHEAMRSYRVRDRLKHLQLPFRDLDMLFMLLDEDGTGLIKCDKFFRGVAKLRGPAKACDLHQMSIDLRRHLHMCDTNLQSVVDANDVLAGLLALVDDMETGILQSDLDAGDPVLMSRRVRGKIDWNKRMRGKWAGEEPIRAGSKDPWISFEDAPAESKEVPDEDAKTKKVKAVVKATVKHKGSASELPVKQKKKKKKEVDTSQPAPPPLPPHLQVLRARSPKKSSKKRSGSASRSKLES